MKPTLSTLFTLVLLGFAASAVADGEEGKSATTFDFDTDKPGDASKGFAFGRTGRGSLGKWVVQAAKDAPSGGNVLVQTDTDDTDYRFLVAYTGRQIASFSGKVKPGVWHELAAEAKGDHLEIYFDGKKIMDAHDKTFTEAGKFGLWTQADSLIHFDDLTATPK